MKNTSTSCQGIYLHIPFCSFMCHYCDFAKTARFDNSLIRAYFLWLKREVEAWLDVENGMFSSVYLGGGTPGLFAKEYEDIFSLLRPRLLPESEWTIEANPNDLLDNRILLWKDLGINRLSIGVQSFHRKELAFLTRDHDANVALLALDKALKHFSNVNIDLMYGLVQQPVSSFESSLKIACKSGVPHLSCYGLSIERDTVFGRRKQRGIPSETSDERFIEHYQTAVAILGENGFLHEEVSNWAKGDFEAKHNRLYWTDQSYLGIGLGAHGYFSDQAGPGLRYFYPRDIAAWARQEKNTSPPRALVQYEQRDAQDWLLEYVGSALRSKYGVDLKQIELKSGKRLFNDTKLQRANEKGVLQQSCSTLVLDQAEWIRETAWSHLLTESLH